MLSSTNFPLRRYYIEHSFFNCREHFGDRHFEKWIYRSLHRRIRGRRFDGISTRYVGLVSHRGLGMTFDLKYNECPLYFLNEESGRSIIRRVLGAFLLDSTALTEPITPRATFG